MCATTNLIVVNGERAHESVVVVYIYHEKWMSSTSRD